MKTLFFTLFLFTANITSYVFAQESYSVSGKIIDAESGEPVYATLKFEPFMEPDSVRIIANDGKTGQFTYVLKGENRYNLIVNANGYLPAMRDIDFRNKEQMLIKLHGTKKSDYLEVKNLEFELNSTIIKTGQESLNKVADYMKLNPSIILLLEGHTEPEGDAGYNMRLSKDRCVVVKNYLVEKGISAKRIETKGYGGTRPIYGADSQDVTAANRRVEFKISEAPVKK